MNKIKNNDYLNQGLLVAAVASILGKTSFVFKGSIYVIFSIYFLIKLIKVVKNKSSRQEFISVLSILICSIYSLGGTIKKEFYDGYVAVYDSSWARIGSVFFAIIMVISLILYSYSTVEESNRAAWLSVMKSLLIIIFILSILLGVLYIIFP